MDPRIARRAVAAAIAAGFAADLLFDRVAVGLNVPIFTVAIIVLVLWFGGRRGPADPIDWWLLAVAAIASLGPALRTDPTVLVLDGLLTLGGLAGWSLAVAGIAVTRRATAVLVTLALETIFAAMAGAGLLLQRTGADGFFARQTVLVGRAAPVARGLLVAVPIVGLFTILLASADAVFGRGLEDVLRQPIEIEEAIWRGLFALAAAWLVGGALAIAGGAYRPQLADPGGAPPGGWEDVPAIGSPRDGATEALTVLVAVDALFAVFAVVQVVYLFGGADTLTAIGMTYSDYARQGYFQLVGVVALAGLLLVAAHLVVGRTRAFLIGAFALLGLTEVILASAALRLRLYQEAYGWTELRFYVAASVLWLAGGAAIAAVLLWRDRMRWLAHGLAVSAVVITLGVSALGPHAFVTHENIARVIDPSLVAPGGHHGFDAAYAVTLGDDAVPELVGALDHLAPMDRATVLADLWRRRAELHEDAGSAGWFSWNLARERARAALAVLPER